MKFPYTFAATLVVVASILIWMGELFEIEQGIDTLFTLHSYLSKLFRVSKLNPWLSPPPSRERLITTSVLSWYPLYELYVNSNIYRYCELKCTVSKIGLKEIKLLADRVNGEPEWVALTMPVC